MTNLSLKKRWTPMSSRKSLMTAKEAEEAPERSKLRKAFVMSKKPDWLVKASNNVEEICKHSLFERIVIGLILLNTVSLALEHYEEDEAVTKANEVANLFFTVIFAIEMILKLFGFGWKLYI